MNGRFGGFKKRISQKIVVSGPNWITSFAFLAKYYDTSVYESTFIKWWCRFSRLGVWISRSSCLSFDGFVALAVFVSCIKILLFIAQSTLGRRETRTQQKRKKKKSGWLHTQCDVISFAFFFVFDLAQRAEWANTFLRELVERREMSNARLDTGR